MKQKQSLSGQLSVVGCQFLHALKQFAFSIRHSAFSKFLHPAPCTLYLLLLIFNFQLSIVNCQIVSSLKADSINIKKAVISDTIKLSGFNSTNFSGLSTDSLLTINTKNGTIHKVALSRLKDSLGWGLTGNSGTTAGTNFIGTTDAQDLVFKTGGSAAGNERMRILSGGNVGIGTTSPVPRLQVQSTEVVGTPTIMIGGGGTGPRFQTWGLDNNPNAWMGLGTDMALLGFEHSLYFPNSAGIGRQTIGDFNGTTYNPRMTILANGNVGIGTPTPITPLHVIGSIITESPNDWFSTLIRSTRPAATSVHTTIDFLRTNNSGLANDWLGAFRIINAAGVETGNVALSANGAQDGTNNKCFFSVATVGNTGALTARLTVDQDGNGSIRPGVDNTQNLGTAAARWREVFAGSGVINTSDIRQKKNINPLKYGLKDILRIEPISYSWKTDSTNKIKLGVSAQQLQPILPEVVNVGDDENKTLGVMYSDLIPVLINAIKEQQAMIEELKKEVEALKTR